MEISIKRCLASPDFLAPGEVAKNSKKIQEAEKANVPVVSEDYLEAVETEEAIAAISKHNLVSWGAKKKLLRQQVSFDDLKYFAFLKKLKFKI